MNKSFRHKDLHLFYEKESTAGINVAHKTKLKMRLVALAGCPRIAIVARGSHFDHLMRIVVLFSKMTGKYDQIGFSAVDYSILGQPARYRDLYRRHGFAGLSPAFFKGE